MTPLAWVVVGLLAAGLAVVVLGWTRAARRLARADTTARALEQRLAAVERSSAQALDTARDAAALARRASGAAEPAPRVVLEPVTGPLVKAVAFGAGARRAVARLARPAGGRR
jgi:type II secretory pathway pseudopilin PulG